MVPFVIMNPVLTADISFGSRRIKLGITQSPVEQFQI